MEENQIHAAFAAFDPTHPFYLAVLALLDAAVLAEQDNVTVPNLTDAARHFNAGRLAHAKDMREAFTDTMRDAIAGQMREQIKEMEKRERRGE